MTPDTLQDKIIAILNHHRNGLTKDQHRIPAEESYAQIIKCIEDKGYVKLPPRITEYGSDFQSDVMPRQEFYDRFVKELDDEFHQFSKPMPGVPGVYYDAPNVMKAARKAAGLDG